MKNIYFILLIILSFSCDSNRKKENKTNETAETELNTLEKNKAIDTITNHMNSDAVNNQTKTEYNSNLRPNKTIELNKTYIDTIVFSMYDDDYDYGMLLGKKHAKPIALIYNWDHESNDKYNFKNGDIIKVTWKMDSFSNAGDEDIVDFRERALDADRVLSEK